MKEGLLLTGPSPLRADIKTIFSFETRSKNRPYIEKNTGFEKRECPPIYFSFSESTQLWSGFIVCSVLRDLLAEIRISYVIPGTKPGSAACQENT